MTRWLRHMVSATLNLAALYTATSLLGFALLVLAFKLGLFQEIDILFYRGLVLIVLAFAATFALLAPALGVLRSQWLGPRDAFAASILSLSLNLSFLIVVPVTVDRSISIFMLGEMAAHPEESFTPATMSALFTKVYVGDRHQIERRLHEQTVSGNVETRSDGYRISARGRMVITTARIVAALFDSHAGLLAPDQVKPSAPEPAAPAPR